MLQLFYITHPSKLYTVFIFLALLNSPAFSPISSSPCYLNASKYSSSLWPNSNAIAALGWSLTVSPLSSWRIYSHSLLRTCVADSYQDLTSNSSLKAGLFYAFLNPWCTVYYLVQIIYSIKVYWVVSFKRMGFLWDIYPHTGTSANLSLCKWIRN